MHEVLLNAVKEKAWGLDPQMYHVDDLSEVVLQSLAVALQAAGDRAALRVLVDVCHKTRPEGVPGIVGGFPKGEENRGGSRGPDSRLESGSQNPNRRPPR